MANKQTPVEFLIEEWLHLDAEFDMMLIDKKIYWERLRQKQSQAKAMEKEQIIEAYKQGQHDSDPIRETDAEEYYNQSYGKEK